MYSWNCLPLNNSEEQHIIPSIQRCPNPNQISFSSRDILYIFPFMNLSDHCLGSVFSIKYCYHYESTTGSGAHAVIFNWTIIALDNNYSIISIFHTESASNRLNCTNTGGRITCCDVTRVKDFNLSRDIYAFGITESVYGNTHNATLSAFHSSREDYQVATALINSNNLMNSLAVGYSLSNHHISLVSRGLRCLWFVIAKWNLLYITKIFNYS